MWILLGAAYRFEFVSDHLFGLYATQCFFLTFTVNGWAGEIYGWDGLGAVGIMQVLILISVSGYSVPNNL